MRRLALSAVPFVASLAVLAAPAQATFHLNRINEVMLAASGGDASVQFVELLDHGGTEEAFTPAFAPYKLVVYDAAANKLGEHTLSPDGLRAAAAADTEYLISTAAADAALGVTGNESLDVTLPAGAGQACFEANPNPPAFSCLTWGKITKPVPTNSMGTGSASGPTPPDGESDQRQTDGSVVAATPTPKARNHATGPGTTTPPGQTPPGQMPPAPKFAGVRVRARTLAVRTGRVTVPVRCPTGSGGCSGRITLVTAHGQRLGRVSFRLAAGAAVEAHVKLTRAGKQTFAGKQRLSARAVVAARNGTGQRKTTSRAVVLRRA